MATSFLVVKNRAYSKSAAAITAVATTLTVTAGEGANFPSTYPFHLTIDDEIVSCTNRSTDSLTIVRAQQGTSGATHANKAYVALNITAKSVTDLNTAVNTIEATVVNGEIILGDDKFVKYGVGTDAQMGYETADANAFAMVLGLPHVDEDANNVAVLAIGDIDIINKDLTFFNGVVLPTVAVLNVARDAYISIDSGDINASGKGVYFKAAADEDVEIINLSVGGTPRIYWDETENQFRSTHGWVFDALCDVQGVWVATATWTLPAITLGGTVTINGQAFDAGSGDAILTTTGSLKGLDIRGSNSFHGPQLRLWHNHTTPDANVIIGLITYLGYDGNASPATFEYGSTRVKASNVTDTTEEGTFEVRLATAGAEDNLAMTLSGAGALWIDAGLTIGGTFTDGTATLTSGEWTGATLNAMVAKGTWTASGTWTIPAVTLGGTVTLNGQVFDAGAGFIQANSTRSETMLLLQSTQDSGSGSGIILHHESANPANDDYVGSIIGRGRNSNAEEYYYCAIRFGIESVTDGSEAGYMLFQNRVGAGWNISMKLSSAGALNLDSVLQAGAAMAATVAYNRFGAIATSHSLTSDDDLMISGKLEVTGLAYFDSDLLIADTKGIFTGTSAGDYFVASAYNTNDSARIEAFRITNSAVASGLAILEVTADFYMVEKAAAGPDIEARGQWWVKSQTPNEPWFTGDDGVDHPLLGKVYPLANTYISGSGTAGADNTAQTVITAVIPANTITQLGDRLRVRVYFRGDTGGAVTMTCTVNGVTIASQADGGGTTWFMTETWLHYIDSTHANIAETGAGAELASSTANAAGFDWTSAQDVDCDQNQVAGNHIVVYAIFLDVYPKGLI